MIEYIVVGIIVVTLINTVNIRTINKRMEATIKEETMFKIAVIENLKMLSIKANKKTTEELNKLN